MARQSKTPPTFEGATTDMVPAPLANGIQLSAFMASKRETVKTIQAIGEQVLIDQALQAGIEMKARYAFHLQKELNVQTLQTIDAYQQERQAILDRPGRDARNQKLLEECAATLDTEARKTFFATRQGAVNAILTVVVKPLDAPTEESEIVITEEPNGIAKFFGASTKITRIRR